MNTKTSTFIKADENREYRTIHSSSVSLKGIGEKLQHLAQNGGWEVSNI